MYAWSPGQHRAHTCLLAWGGAVPTPGEEPFPPVSPLPFVLLGTFCLLVIQVKKKVQTKKTTPCFASRTPWRRLLTRRPTCFRFSPTEAEEEPPGEFQRRLQLPGVRGLEPAGVRGEPRHPRRRPRRPRRRRRPSRARPPQATSSKSVPQ